MASFTHKPQINERRGERGKKVYLIFFCEIGAGFQQHTGRESGFIS